jgi:hypothetical protein
MYRFRYGRSSTCGNDCVQKATGDMYVQTIEESVLKAMNSRTIGILAEWQHRALIDAGAMNVGVEEASLGPFYEHRKLNPQWNLSFRYVTATDLGIERDWDGCDSAIASWEAIRQRKYGAQRRQSQLACL